MFGKKKETPESILKKKEWQRKNYEKLPESVREENEKKMKLYKEYIKVAHYRRGREKGEGILKYYYDWKFNQNKKRGIL